jgi:protein TonB
VVGGIAEPAPAVEPAPVLRIGGFLKEPRKIKHVDPSYPQIASDAGIQGLIILEAVIDETGHVVDARVLRGVPLLDAAALEAVRQWVYLPTLLNGVPRRVVLTATVNFRLRRPPGE